MKNKPTGTITSTCPLCGHRDLASYHQDRYRSYWSCRQCALIFVPPKERPDIIAEKTEYDKHNNDPTDPAYREFLTRLVNPLLERLKPGANGLDFGCGPGPALSSMFQEAGMHMRLYDVFYAPDPTVWYHQYDFITCTEVVEHLHSPGRELRRLFDVLMPGGWLGVMTKRVIDREAFTDWHYIRDLTHVCFFSEHTLRWVAAYHGAKLILPAEDVALFQKRTRRGHDR